MRWAAELFAFSLSLGFSVVLASSCGTPGLGVDHSGFGAGGGTSSGSTGGAAVGGSASTGIFFEGGTSDGSYGECVPKTCTELDANCGPGGDGCGNLLQCGNCQAPQTCGGGGKPST